MDISTIFGFCGALPQIEKYFIIPIKKHCNYLRRSDKLIQDLRDKAKLLYSSKEHLQERIEAEENNLQSIKPSVREWCRQVDELKESTDKILCDENEPQSQDGTRHRGTCSNIKLRYSRGRKATKLTADVARLQQEFNDFVNNPVSDPRTLTSMPSIPSASYSHQLQSRMQTEEEIMAYLRGDSVSMIGIYGMGGLGKTTMAKNIKDMAIQQQLFDKAVMAVVSQQVDVLRIQKQLAQDLGLDLSKAEEREDRAKLLYNRLQKGKVLIILDDVWNSLELKEVGIIFPSKNKIIITSRNQRACKMMSIKDVTRILTLNILKEEEAISLLLENTGSIMDQSNLRPFAEELAKECKGLPLALKTVGCALREETNESVWKHFLRQMKQAEPKDIPEYLQNVYQPLELSYNYLDGDEAKYLFLLCCLFPEDSEIAIEALLHYCIALRVLSGTERSISDARGRVHSLVDTLINRCLLIDAGEWNCNKYVKMHDVLRDMAIYISSSGQHAFFVEHRVEHNKEWPQKKANEEDYRCISITMDIAMEIPESRNWPRLEALSVDFSSSSTESELPVDFFNGMAGLKLLHIEMKSQLSLLSLHFPTNLRVLSLYNCDLLQNISFIGQLVNLEVFICQHSAIEEIPNEMKSLKKLKLLDLSYCSELRNIPRNVLSSLVKMEELRLLKCPIEWGYEEPGDEASNASLGEVFSLRNLRALHIWILNSKVIPLQVSKQLSFTSFCITIGQSYSNMKYLKSMCIGLEEMGEISLSIFHNLFEVAEQLWFEGNGMKDTIEELGRHGFKNVKSLRIRRLAKVKHLSDAEYGEMVFPVLRDLQLREMEDLEEICSGSLAAVRSFSVKLSMSNLERIDIWRCDSLKWIFPISAAESLCLLKTFEVRSCSNIQQIFEDESGCDTVRDAIKFPKLKGLVLEELPKLCGLSKTDCVFEFPSLKRLEIYKVSPSFEFPKAEVSWEEIQFMTLSDYGGMKIFSSIGIFMRIRSLTIQSFPILRILFSEKVSRDLINLESLYVGDCEMLKYICGRDGDENEGDDDDHPNMIHTPKTILFPKLQYLHLRNLPKIRYLFPCGSGLELPSLLNVSITDCPEIERIGGVEMERNNNNNIMRNCSTLIQNTFIPFDKQVSFPALQKLTIRGCHNLKSLFTSQSVSLKCLQSLYIEDCSMLEYVIGKEEFESDIYDEEGSSLKTNPTIIRFPKLTHLNLRELPKMCGFSIVDCNLEFPSMEGMSIIGCTEMKNFGTGSNEASELLFNEKVSFGALKRLIIEGYYNLKSLFTPRSVLFQSLEFLKIRDCLMLEYVIDKEEVKSDFYHEKGGHDLQTDPIIISFPKLTNLTLSKLPKMRGFSNTNCNLEFSSMKKMQIIDCTEMKSFGVGSLHLPAGTIVDGILEANELCELLFNRKVSPDRVDILSDDCLMLSSSDLSFTYAEERRPLLVKGLSDTFFAHNWYKVRGKFEIEKLPQEITYEIVFVIMLLRDPEDCEDEEDEDINNTEREEDENDNDIEEVEDEGDEDIDNSESKEDEGDEDIDNSESKEDEDDKDSDDDDDDDATSLDLATKVEGETRLTNLKNMTTKVWIEIVAGNFKPSSHQFAEITFSLNKGMSRQSMIAVKGVRIRPKENVAEKDLQN